MKTYPVCKACGIMFANRKRKKCFMCDSMTEKLSIHEFTMIKRESWGTII